MIPTPGGWYKRWNREIVISGIKGSRILSRALKTNFKTRKVIPRGRITKIPAKILVRRCLKILLIILFGDLQLQNSLQVLFLDHLFLHQETGEFFQLVSFRHEDFLYFLMAFVDDLFHLFVDLFGGIFAVFPGRAEGRGKEKRSLLFLK